MSGLPKNPAAPAGPLEFQSHHVYPYQGALWRIHRTVGPHAAQWSTMRSFGSLRSFRWEPHPEPQQVHPGAAVSYTAADYTTAFAEVFQSTRIIRLSEQRTLSAWTPVRALQLLDLVPPSDWSLRYGASASLPYAARNICRGWARAIYAELGGTVDGLRVPSTLTGAPMVVLFSRAESAFPVAPEFSRALSHDDVAALAHRAAKRLNWACF